MLVAEVAKESGALTVGIVTPGAISTVVGAVNAEGWSSVRHSQRSRSDGGCFITALRLAAGAVLRLTHASAVRLCSARCSERREGYVRTRTRACAERLPVQYGN